MNITVFTSYDRITLFHTLKPFLFHHGRFRFTFTDSPRYCLEQDRNNALVVLRLPRSEKISPLEYMQRFRARYERLIYFNDVAAAGKNNFEFLPLVDRFWVKSIFRQRSDYLKKLYRLRLFTEYYHFHYGAADDDSDGSCQTVNEADLSKLRLAWNIGVGDFPRQDFRQRIGVAVARTVGPRLSKALFITGSPTTAPLYNRRDIPVHARLGSLPKPSVNRQRELFKSLVAGDSRFLTGYAPKKQYDREMRRSMMTLSPFGWGEVCFRDFEALLSGSLLLKPDMAHLETWPDIYITSETFVSLAWDGSDLLEKVEHYLSKEKERLDMVRQAQENYYKQLYSLQQRFLMIMEEALC